MKKSLGAQTILVPTPVLIIGTYDKKGKPNAAAVAWGGICCSKPPCVAISLRAATYTHGNITNRMSFTINIPPEKYVKEADFFGTVSGRAKDKFAFTKLTPVKGDFVDAPYIQEFPLNLECSVINVIEIGLHTQFIAEIKDVKADEAVFNPQGQIDASKIRPFFFSPGQQGYFATGHFLGQAFNIGNEIGK